jgi:hypothetical protein
MASEKQRPRTAESAASPEAEAEGFEHAESDQPIPPDD